jgi:hypothetical protein
VEGAVKSVADDSSKSCLSSAWRAPKNHRGNVSALNKSAEYSSWTHKVLLTYVVVKASWA